jgi:hypothetical protein
MAFKVVSVLMIAEIVSNGLLSLPSTLAAVGKLYHMFCYKHLPIIRTICLGIVPAVILIVFLGGFGLFTAKLLIDFKTNHPQVHSMFVSHLSLYLCSCKI